MNEPPPSQASRFLKIAFRDILNDQQVLRQAFDDAARDFIQHERRQIEIEERQLFPAILSILAPADWAALRTQLRDQKELPRTRGLEERLQARRRWISREPLADQSARSPVTDVFDI